MGERAPSPSSFPLPAINGEIEQMREKRKKGEEQTSSLEMKTPFSLLFLLVFKGPFPILRTAQRVE